MILGARSASKSLQRFPRGNVATASMERKIDSLPQLNISYDNSIVSSILIQSPSLSKTMGGMTAPHD
jgi:hypothetical protein